MLHRGLGRWGAAVYRLRWAIVIAWVVLIALSGWLSTRYADVLSGGGWDIPESESLKAKQLLTEQFAGRSETSLLLLFQDRETTAGEAAYNEKLQRTIDYVSGEDGVESVYSLLNAADAVKPGLIGADGHTTYAFVNFDVEEDFAVNMMPDIQQRLGEYAEDIGVTSYLIGPSALWGDVSVYSQEGLVKAEMIVFPLIFIILLIVFRSVVATITPMVVTVAAIVTGMGLVYAVASQVEMSVFVTNSALMLGIGVSIDYSLFMVNRFRIELDRYKDVNKAMAVAMRTSGHTILFSGITIVAAMIALFVVNVPAIRAIAFGAIAVVIFAVLSTLSLLPALLTMLGERINTWRIPSLIARRNAPVFFWSRWAQAMMKRPALFLLLTIAMLVVFSIPVKDMKLNSMDVDVLPAESPARQGFELYEAAFETGGTTVGSLTIRAEEGQVTDESYVSYLTKLHGQLAALEDVNQVSSVASFTQGMDAASASAFLQSDRAGWPPGLQPMIDRYVSRDAQYAVIDITFGASGASDASRALVERIRTEVIPASNPPQGASFLLGGDTAQAIDMNDAIYDAIPSALFVMLGLIYIILLITFRSVLLPLKAIVMNLFSVGATFGIVTWVFAEGHGIGLFNAAANGYIVNFIPLLMLALLFGLSTDYEVFLVGRVQEHYEETGNNEESIAVGLQTTGPLITGAAVLMIAVFTGFAFSSMLPIQMLGFGMAVAILLDATIVRLLIVPSAMKLLGQWNWWMPGRKPPVRTPGATHNA